jgi:hypothetical protein
MTDGNELLQKVIDTTMLGATGQGLLTPQQGNRFIDYMEDATVLGRDARTIRMRGDVVEIDRMHVGERLARVATEAVDDHVGVGVTFSKISLTSTKIRLDWELSTEALEDNLEGEGLEDHIARLMATQFGNDLEDVAINGDASSPDPLLKAFDGWRKRAHTAGRVVDAHGRVLDTSVFNAAIKAMPRQYKQRRNQLRFYTGSNLIQDWQYNLFNNGSDAAATAALTGGIANTQVAFGIPIVEVPLFDETRPGAYTTADEVGAPAGTLHGELELTFPDNRIWGVKRDIVVYREFKPKKDSIDYTVFTRVGVAVENLDAYVVVKNVRVASS